MQTDHVSIRLFIIQKEKKKYTFTPVAQIQIFQLNGIEESYSLEFNTLLQAKLQQKVSLTSFSIIKGTNVAQFCRQLWTCNSKTVNDFDYFEAAFNQSNIRLPSKARRIKKKTKKPNFNLSQKEKQMEKVTAFKKFPEGIVALTFC